MILILRSNRNIRSEMENLYFSLILKIRSSCLVLSVFALFGCWRCLALHVICLSSFSVYSVFCSLDNSCKVWRICWLLVPILASIGFVVCACSLRDVHFGSWPLRGPVSYAQWAYNKAIFFRTFWTRAILAFQACQTLIYIYYFYVRFVANWKFSLSALNK
jgi:hypothetical protein